MGLLSESECGGLGMKGTIGIVGKGQEIREGVQDLENPQVHPG